MPVFQYEAMDSNGLEVKDTIEAPTEGEAQTIIREKGYYVTKIRERERKKKSKAAWKKPCKATSVSSKKHPKQR